MEVWQTSSLRRLRLGEEIKEEERRRTNDSLECFTVVKHYLLDFIWYRAIIQCTRTVNVLRVTTKVRIKIVRKGIPTRMSVVFLQLWPNGSMDQDATW